VKEDLKSRWKEDTDSDLILIKRKKCIIIEDSYKKYMTEFTLRSSRISARRPLERDDDVVNYELDSEDEWNEENGEDLNAQGPDESDEDEDMADEEEAEEFGKYFIPDDYLSQSELGSQASGTPIKKAYSPEKLDSISLPPMFIKENNAEGNDQYFEQFKAVSFKRQLPITL